MDRRQLLRVLKICLTMIVVIWMTPVFALDGITIVLSEDSGAYADFAHNLNASLASQSKPIASKITTLTNLRNEDVARSTGNQLIVAVGTPAMQAIAQKPLSLPVLNVLVSRESFFKLTKTNPKLADYHQFSAIYFDQSISRQLNLIRIVMGRSTTIGALLGADSSELIPRLNTASKETGMPIKLESITNEADLIPSLRNLLAECDVLLALPDAMIYNRNNIPSILLTSYRQKIPLFGFSSAYVKAGALAAVYSTPSQISQQVSELLQNQNSSSLPAPQFPRYFSVGINTQVAHSLGLPVDDETSVLNKLKQATERAP